MVAVYRHFIAGVKLEVLMPKCILNCSLTANQGKYNYDPVSKVLHWDVGRIDVTKLPNIRGSVRIDTLYCMTFIINVTVSGIYRKWY